MAVPDMSVSKKALTNKKYKIVAVFRNMKKTEIPDEKDMVGIRLLNAKHGYSEWNENGGVIKMSQLSEDARAYVLDSVFEKRRVVKDIFGGLGD